MKLGRREREELDASIPARPRLADDVQVHPPAHEGAPWIIQRGPARYIRVGADMARLGRALDGDRDHAELMADLGPKWTPQALGYALGELKRMQLLDDGRRTRRDAPWVKYVPPLTLQVTLLRPARFLAWCAPLVSALATRFWGVVAAVVAVAGLVSLAARGGDLAETLGAPLPLDVYAGVAAGTYLVMVLHELGHGAVLSHYGGRPSRMGVMLLYLLPAFFCDVSDGWRLARKEQRVRVALAGVATQFVAAGAAAVAALPFGGSDAGRGLLVLSVVTYVGGVLNLLPFVKLDGYLALMSHLDISDLRKRAMIDARRFVSKLLFGGAYPVELPGPRWAVPYGIACLVFPIYLVGGLALSLWGDLLRGLGPVGSLAVMAVVLLLVARLAYGFLARVHEARVAGASVVRIGAVTAGLAMGVTALLTLVHVPYEISGGYHYRQGRVELVVPGGHEEIRRGAAVRLLRNGVVLREQVGSAVVASGTAASASAPISVLLPVRTERDLPVSVSAYPLAVREAPAEPSGAARVEAGSPPLGEWLVATYLSGAW
ncbi:daptide biosynthesis intramembrane metalloprotease [Nonomuraea sp. NPDC050451]|uniref:daptide biosynthesis intramembrane metalloprotease n=1 Tax=Nonomuraea sp. NPDC050451 TaxID=3364364 RepID=UPI0037BD2FA3